MGGISEELQRLFALYEVGALTEAEFAAAKQRVLGPGPVIEDSVVVESRPARDVGPVDLRDADCLGVFLDEVDFVGSMPLPSEVYVERILGRSDYGDPMWRLIWTGRPGGREVIAMPVWARAPWATGAMNDILCLLPTEAASFTRPGQASQLLDILDPLASDRRPREAPETAKALRRLLKELPSPVYAGSFRDALLPFFAQHDEPGPPIEFRLNGHPPARVSSAGLLSTAAHSALDELLACDCDYDDGCLCAWGSTASWFYREAQGVWQLHDAVEPSDSVDGPFVETHFDRDDLLAWVGAERPDYEPEPD